ncbi:MULTISPECIES: phosphoribosyltransferase family protein [unclassified Wenzhouxiangella]|uniref:phosphoribosyltransferase family protein n=1 Tax=unclassified Wenzhouxiangella TaxID=2613841 RepID=UPI0015F29356|nr:MULTISPECIES: phosphoribosyltransferase family protein [unclassified Wenzhouxiangella]
MTRSEGDEKSELQVIDADGVEGLLDELAGRIAPHIGASTVLVGIVRRGKPLAEMLADRLARDHGRHPEIGVLELKRYSDSLELLHHRPHLDDDELDVDIEDRHMILVDDVLYTGETMFHAACYLRAEGATHIQTAFLCARPGLKMPVHADFVGARFDIRPDWVIHCTVPPYESHLGIELAHQDVLR